MPQEHQSMTHQFANVKPTTTGWPTTKLAALTVP